MHVEGQSSYIIEYAGHMVGGLRGVSSTRIAIPVANWILVNPAGFARLRYQVTKSSMKECGMLNDDDALMLLVSGYVLPHLHSGG